MRTIERVYAKSLGEEVRMMTRMVRRGNTVIEFSVSLFLTVNDQEHEVTRFDNSHNQSPHQHVFFSTEEGRIITMPSQSVNQALTFAQETIKKTHAKLCEFYVLNKLENL